MTARDRIILAIMGWAYGNARRLGAGGAEAAAEAMACQEFVRSIMDR